MADSEKPEDGGDHSPGNRADNVTSASRLAAGFSSVLVLLALWRILTLLLHEPLLGYANNFDMIRLQACHQVWPADPGIAAGVRTETAPLEWYTLSRQLDAPCFASSEWLFTSAGVGLARLGQWLTGEPVFSIRLVGGCKALVLAVTILLAHWQFWRQGRVRVMGGHAVLVVLLLSDPAITLYLNTFYTEFSAAYFLYLTLLGLVLLSPGTVGVRDYLPLLAGLAGLALSKAQHLPIALMFACLASAWLWRRNASASALLAVMLAAVLPAFLLGSGVMANRDDGYNRVIRADLLGAMLGTLPASQHHDLLQRLSMPTDCLPLAGSNWHQQTREAKPVCDAIGSLDYRAVAWHFARDPGHLLDMLRHAIPRSQRWIVGFYGQVAGEKLGQASEYTWSLNLLLKMVPSGTYTLLFCLPGVLLCAEWLLRRGASLPLDDGFLLALVLLAGQWAVLVVSVVGDGFVDIPRHTHLSVTLLLAQYAVTPYRLLPRGFA